MYNATQLSRDYASSENAPVLIEAMTYRVSHHSTSDDSLAYRSKSEVEAWTKDSPITRFRNYLYYKSYWTPEEDTQFRKSIRSEVLKAFSAAEKLPKPPVKELFTDVYDTMPPHIQEQQRELEELIEKYPDHYDTSLHVKS